MNRYRAQDPWLVEHRDDVYMTMIETAEIVAERYKVTRERQDEYALQSQQRTAAAQAAGRFDAEIAPLPTVMKVVDKATGAVSDKPVTLKQDEGPRADTTLGWPRGAEARVRRRAADQGGLVHHRRQRLATLGRRQRLRLDGGQAREPAQP